jgi:cellulase/cellobiase CelA1
MPPPAAASAAPPPAPSVTISYTLVAQWIGGLLAAFTITNDGSTGITGWQLSATFPGDQIQDAWGTDTPNSSSDDLTVGATADLPTIAPGTSQTVYFAAQGATTVPAACTFDGAACPVSAGQGSPYSG